MTRKSAGLARALAAVSLVALGLGSVAAVARASESPPDSTRRYASQRGFQLGLRFASTDLGGRTEPGADNAFVIDPKGGGLALRIGYQFTPNVALALDLRGSSHDTNIPGEPATYGTVGFDLRYQWVTGSRFQPFVLGGLGASVVGFRAEGFDAQIAGALAVLGGGVQLHLSRHWRLELGARWDFINWSNVEIVRLSDGVRLSDPVSADGYASSLGLGLVWAF